MLPSPRTSDTNGAGHHGDGGMDLRTAVAEIPLLPTPDAKPFSVGTTIGDVIYENAWGEYAPAIRRWEAITRPAPGPTKLNAKGNPKLSDEFDEWLMGLPAGWITDVPGVTWNETLKACGNGVVPQQCAASLRFLRVMADWRVAA